MRIIIFAIGVVGVGVLVMSTPRSRERLRPRLNATVKWTIVARGKARRRAARALESVEDWMAELVASTNESPSSDAH